MCQFTSSKRWIQKEKKNYTNFTGRTYRNYSTNILHEKLDNKLNLDTFLEINNPVECWNKLYDSLVTIANEIVPKKEYKVKVDKP